MWQNSKNLKDCEQFYKAAYVKRRDEVNRICLSDTTMTDENLRRSCIIQACVFGLRLAARGLLAELLGTTAL